MFTNYTNYNFTSGQYFILNIIWIFEIDLYPGSGYYSNLLSVRFDYVLAFVSMFIWLKVIIYMKYIKDYGIIFAIV